MTRSPYSESTLQKYVAKYLNDLEALTKAFTWSHPPNESRRSPRQGAELKRAGMRAGETDIVIYAKGGKTTFIELKTKKGRLSDAQEVRIETLRRLGYTVYIVYAETPKETVDEVDTILKDAL